ncbi:MAG: hypothetical protein WCL04_02255 [Verrucomicrobiota bacterium]
MKTMDAKFLLRALRPDGRDTADPLFAEALVQVGQDPALAAWLAREQQTDTALAAKLAEIMPPAGLRDAILVGARASRPRRAWWQQPLRLAAAAAGLVLVFSLIWLRRSAHAELASVGLHDLAAAHNDHQMHQTGVAQLETRLADGAGKVPAVLAGLDLAQLRAGGCRTITADGHTVFELCFNRDGAWYHVYAARAGDFSATVPQLAFATQGALAAATWADGDNLYAVVTDAGTDALRRVL